MRMLLPGEGQPLAIGRPGNRRCRWAGRRALRQAPCARGQPLCFSAFCRKNPDVRGERGCGREEIIVADLEGIMMFFDFLLVLRLVVSDVTDLFTVVPPAPT